MKDLINTSTFLWIILPIFASFGMTLHLRYMGRDFEKCENYKQRIQTWFFVLVSTFINYVIMIIMMGIIYLTYK